MLALQFYEGDALEAAELAKLICDIEPQKRTYVDFAVCYRRDTPQRLADAVAEIARTKFDSVHMIQGKRNGKGWPQGPNDLWAETMMRASMMKREKKTQADAILTFEPDCIPMRPDWIDVLRSEWAKTDGLGLDIFGHAHSNHINGNLVARIGLLRKYPVLNGSGNQGWDAFHGTLLLKIGRDSFSIFQHYRMRGANRNVVERLRKDGAIPALFHGIKKYDGFNAVREMIGDGSFQERSKPQPDLRKDQTCIITLGRYGDILNILPLAKHLNDAGDRPAIMISNRFSDIKPLCDYADFIEFDGDHSEYTEALSIAHADFRRVADAAVYGDGLVIKQPATRSFQEEAYFRAGFHELFTTGKADEIKVSKIKSDNPHKGKILLFLNGHSSPIDATTRARIISICEKSNKPFVDMSSVKLPSFSHLETALREASLVITIDTGSLHLCGAVGTPYIALVSDSPTMWHGAHTRGNCIMRARYSQAGKWLPQIKAAIESEWSNKPRISSASYVPPFIGEGAHRRNFMAEITRRSAAFIGGIKSIVVRDEEIEERFTESSGRSLPRIKAVIDAAMKSVGDEPIIFANTDTCFATNIVDQILSQAIGAPCAWASRRDFKSVQDPIHDSDIGSGIDYVGTDLFMLTKAWWNENRAEYPDEMLIATEGWDSVLRELMRLKGGVKMHNIIYHEMHPSTWENPRNRYRLESQRVSLKAASDWFKGNGLDPKTFGIKVS